MPKDLRSAFLSRLHSENTAIAVGAWAELEFAYFAQSQGFTVQWARETANSVLSLRSVDMSIRRGAAELQAEVTHCMEEPLAPNASAVFSLIGRMPLPPGVYVVTWGEGQPPISRLRGALKTALATKTTINVQIEDWGIRQADPTPRAVDYGDAGTERLSLIVERGRLALKRKRRQAREAGHRQCVFALLIFDRDSSKFVERAAKEPRLLAAPLWGSAGLGSVTRAVAIGSVALDHFPPVPVWTIAVRDGDAATKRLFNGAPQILVPVDKAPTDVDKLDEQRDATKTAVCYAPGPSQRRSSPR